MIPELRRAYNAGFSEERYRSYAKRLSERGGGMEIPFRLAETPVFLPPALRDEMVEASLEIFRQLSTPAALQRSLAAVPQRFDVPGCDDLPVFAVTDFAVAQEAGGLVPRLIELQAFPTLYAFQVAQSEELSYICPDGHRLDWYLSGLDTPSYKRVVGEAILSGLAPAEVILLDLDPPHQKTAIDFAFTEKFWGVRALDPSQIEKRGRELWYDRDGKRIRIRRIYNRLIFDELEAKRAELPFDLTSRLDVSWAGHPNWYFRWSKHCLPEISHPTVPESRLLCDFAAPPMDLENWVLKPLFSFAGSGVKVEVTPQDLAAIPETERAHWILMRKIEYAPAIATADGNFSKVEVRVMFVWRNGAPYPVTTLARLSQGKMMGVNYNKDKTWVGSSGNLWPK